MADPYTCVYAQLGLRRGAGAPEVRKAYRELAMKHHPDKVEGCAEEFKRINSAYSRIMRGDTRVRPQAGARPSARPAGFQGRPAGLSKGMLAAIIVLPMAVAGIKVALSYRRFLEHSGRTEGLLQKPINPFLEQEGVKAKQ